MCYLRHYFKPKSSVFSLLFLGAVLLCSSFATAQIVDDGGYLIGEHLEVAVDGVGGHEGTSDWVGHHSRGGGTVEVPYGFVANPQDDDWIDYDGDFFTAGSPENGFGVEINGTNYSNNGWDAVEISPYFSEIPVAPGGEISYAEIDGCLTIDWEGLIAGVRIHVKYNLIEDALFYTTEVTLTNTTGTNLWDVYYYRNLDPDNNQALGAPFATRNEIESQPGVDCIKALVSAKQTIPWDSYLGFGALGDNFRVTHGGFSNRDASDIWNGLGGLNSTIGDVVTDDEAISLAYKTDLLAGESVSFTYAIVLEEEAVEEAFSSLYFINFVSEYDEGGGDTSPCSPAVIYVNSCAGNEITLNIDGPSTDDYLWTWIPTGEENDTIVINPTEPIVYTVVGYPIEGCLTGVISKSASIVFTYGPELEIEFPEFACDSVDITTLPYVDISEGENTHCVFLTEQPDSAKQTEPDFEGPMIGRYDDVWLMCGDTVTGCFTWEKLEFNWVGEGSAGDDTTWSLCSGPYTTIDLTNMISDSANLYGTFIGMPETDLLDGDNGIFYASGLSGTYEFAYIVEGFESCPPDTAFFTVVLKPSPVVYFDYSVSGYSHSVDGINSTCIINTINFHDTMYVLAPDTITDFVWTFGDGESAWIENPSHIYEEQGTYGITLTATSSEGCIGIFSQSILIYIEPPVALLYDHPICYDSQDGRVYIDVLEQFGPFTTEITDEDDVLRNLEDIDTAFNCGDGQYYGYVEDFSGCVFRDTVDLQNPPFLDIFYTIHHPPCRDDSGYVVIDSVVGESLNNPVGYEWFPNPAGIEGIGADSSYWMKGGDYSLTATDSKGCTNTVDFTLINPPLFYFTEWGWDTAYCRLHDFQSGNGVVYAAAAGGVPNYTYEWEYLVDGSTFGYSTWGGRNPGDHRITVTDGGGCVLTKILSVDSVNPIASFDLVSAQLNENCEGTADIEVVLTNTSKYYADSNNPNGDTLFLWDLDVTEEASWIISNSFYEEFDTIYKARGESYDVEICLIAYNQNLCSDTACKIITIWEPPQLDPVNVFSPDGDGVNDYFTFVNYQKGIDQFSCIIINRWGVQVGEIDNVSAGWDGIDLNGDPCSEGVYFYTYIGIADNSQVFKGQGNLTLIRGRD